MKYLGLLAAVLSIFNSMNAIADSSDVNIPNPVRVGIKDKSGSTIGLAFAPPSDDGWSMERSGLSVTLRKKTNSSSDNKEIEAYLMNLDSSISPISTYIKTIKRNIEEGYANNKDFRINAVEVTEDPKDGRCARVHLLLEDIRPESIAGTLETKWSEQYVLSCGSLKYKRIGFEVRYYHRYLDSNKDSHFGDEANRVLAKVIIEDN